MSWAGEAIRTYLAHPLRGQGYQFWSGIGSDISEIIGPVLGISVWARHHNCHRKGCWRLGHADPAHGRPACRHHHGEPLQTARRRVLDKRRK